MVESLTAARELTARSRFHGCLLGGAAGDALGSPAESLSLDEIRSRYGRDGLRDLASAYGRIGAITDDTQMTLFTAEGLLRTHSRFRERGVCSIPSVIRGAYLRWLATQGRTVPKGPGTDHRDGWLITNRDLWSVRSPDDTCLAALESGEFGRTDRPLNDSKGAGGVMRVAPVGLIAREAFRLGCDVAALTHGHPTGFLSAGFFTLLIRGLVEGVSLTNSIEHAIHELERWQEHEETLAAVRRALAAVKHDEPSPQAVERLGGGWVAEEALSISIYCALATEDLESGVILAVNHSGDSGATGSMTGALLGTLYGREAIPPRWPAALELRDVIEQIAEDLLQTFVIGHEELPRDWLDRYPAW